MPAVCCSPGAVQMYQEETYQILDLIWVFMRQVDTHRINIRVSLRIEVRPRYVDEGDLRPVLGFKVPDVFLCSFPIGGGSAQHRAKRFQRWCRSKDRFLAGEPDVTGHQPTAVVRVGVVTLVDGDSFH